MRPTRLGRRWYRRQVVPNASYAYQRTDGIHPIREDIVHDALEDHEAMRQIYDEVCRSAAPQAGGKWFNQFVWTYCRHSYAENVVLYTLLGTMGDRGRALADQGHAEHVRLMYDLQRVVSDRDMKRFDAFYSTLRDHMEFEEGPNGVLHHLQQNFASRDQWRLASLEYAMAKAHAPTRPHAPLTANPGVVERARALLLQGPIDKLKDCFTEFPALHELQVQEPLLKPILAKDDNAGAGRKVPASGPQ
ncbi:Hemerythrin-like domain-containing protein [Plasmodiophora brassicae]